MIQRASLRQSGGLILRRAVSTRSVMHLLEVAAKDDVLAKLDRIISNREVKRLDYRAEMPTEGSAIEGFEDCAWLFGQNERNHGLSRLRFVEAATMWRLISRLESPRVAEIGRYRGGTTFLLAAAGATVVSFDVDSSSRQVSDDQALAEALASYGLRDRVDLRIEDGAGFDVEPSSVDLVLLDTTSDDGPLTALFENWWPGLRAGGTLMFRSIHHGDPGSEPARRLLARLATRPDARCLPAVGQWARVVAFGQHGQGPEEPVASGIAGKAG
jgi:predicted O-methyltransferase YrrM